jgi:PAS domain S-box-containing protein
MGLFSYLHFFCFVCYAFLCLVIVLWNGRSRLGGVSAMLMCAFAVWSLCFSVVHNPLTGRPTAQLFLDLSAIGGVAYCPLVLYFALALGSGERVLRSRLLAIALAFGGLVVIIDQIPGPGILRLGSRRWYGWETLLHTDRSSLWYYVYCYATVGAALVLMAKRSFDLRRKADRSSARLILATTILTFAVSLGVEALFPWQAGRYPHVGDIPFLLWAAILVVVPARHRLLALSPRAAAEEITATTTDALVLVNDEEEILWCNGAAEKLFAMEQRHLCTKRVSELVGGIAWTASTAGENAGRAAVVDLEAEAFDSRGTAIPVLVSTAPLEGKRGGAVWVFRNISRQRRLEREVVETGERERLRIGRDLHDELGQALTGVSFASKALEQKVTAGKRVALDEIRTIRRLVDEAGGMVRRLSRGLSPVGMGEEGLAEALEELCSTTEKMFAIPCRLECALRTFHGDQVAADHLYRIAQEAVTNAVRHAEPSTITIRLQASGGKRVLCVEDDGRGISGGADAEGCMGMRIMRYRAQLLGGLLTLTCPPRGGTRVTCTLPAEVPPKGKHG